jgi:hypothetical protein
MLDAAEVVAVLGLVQPSALTRRLAGCAACRLVAIPLVPRVARVRTERLTTVRALAALGQVHRRHPLRTDVRISRSCQPNGRTRRAEGEQDTSRLINGMRTKRPNKTANKTAKKTSFRPLDLDEFQNGADTQRQFDARR